jgi:hypothetical protein
MFAFVKKDLMELIAQIQNVKIIALKEEYVKMAYVTVNLDGLVINVKSNLVKIIVTITESVSTENVFAI